MPSAAGKRKTRLVGARWRKLEQATGSLPPWERPAAADHYHKKLDEALRITLSLGIGLIQPPTSSERRQNQHVVPPSKWYVPR